MQARHDGTVMKQPFPQRRATRFAIALLAGGMIWAAPAVAADMQEDPAAALRLSQKSGRSCTESCMSECRADRTDCKQQSSVEETSCRAQFQMCVRRCVVACSPN